MTTYHGDMVEVVDEEDGAQLLGLEGARQLHQQVHARIPHAVQIVVQLPILHPQQFISHKWPSASGLSAFSIRHAWYSAIRLSTETWGLSSRNIEGLFSHTW